LDAGHTSSTFGLVKFWKTWMQKERFWFSQSYFGMTVGMSKTKNANSSY
jgi:hypothetical protein